MKKNIVNYGLKIVLAKTFVESVASIQKGLAPSNKIILVTASGLVFAAQYIVVDEVVNILFHE